MNVIEVFKNMNGIRRGDLHWERGLNPGLVKSNIRSHFLGAGSFKHRLVEVLTGINFFEGCVGFRRQLWSSLVTVDLSARRRTLGTRIAFWFIP